MARTAACCPPGSVPAAPASQQSLESRQGTFITLIDDDHDDDQVDHDEAEEEDYKDDDDECCCVGMGNRSTPARGDRRFRQRGWKRQTKATTSEVSAHRRRPRRRRPPLVCYVNRPSAACTKAIVVAHDAFGIRSGRTLEICDMLAHELQVMVICPDFWRLENDSAAHLQGSSGVSHYASCYRRGRAVFSSASLPTPKGVESAVLMPSESSSSSSSSSWWRWLERIMGCFWGGASLAMDVASLPWKAHSPIHSDYYRVLMTYLQRDCQITQLAALGFCWGGWLVLHAAEGNAATAATVPAHQEGNKDKSSNTTLSCCPIIPSRHAALSSSSSVSPQQRHQGLDRPAPLFTPTTTSTGARRGRNSTATMRTDSANNTSTEDEDDDFVVDDELEDDVLDHDRIAQDNSDNDDKSLPPLQLSCAVACHPVLGLMCTLHGANPRQVVEQISCPMMILAAGNDANDVKSGCGGVVEQVLTMQEHQEHHLETFYTMTHGWVNRGNVVDDLNTKMEVDRALHLSKAFLARHLQVSQDDGDDNHDRGADMTSADDR